jgi:hypothetical protein
MKTIKLLSLLFVLVLTAASCDTIRVASDYDDNVDFSGYKTYGYFKAGIDKAEISDLDKKRILRAIDEEFAKKGMTKSETPDLLVNIFTQSTQQVDVNQFYNGWGYYGWGWGGYYGWGYPYWGGNYTSVSTSVEGTLYIDLIDSVKKDLVWQGMGTGVLVMDRDKKEARIKEFVTKIIAEFPPQKNTKK